MNSIKYNCDELIISQCWLQWKLHHNIKIGGGIILFTSWESMELSIHSKYIFSVIISKHVWQQLQIVRAYYVFKIYSQLTDFLMFLMHWINLWVFLQGNIAGAVWSRSQCLPDGWRRWDSQGFYIYWVGLESCVQRLTGFMCVCWDVSALIINYCTDRKDLAAEALFPSCSHCGWGCLLWLRLGMLLGKQGGTVP